MAGRPIDCLDMLHTVLTVTDRIIPGKVTQIKQAGLNIRILHPVAVKGTVIWYTVMSSVSFKVFRSCLLLLQKRLD